MSIAHIRKNFLRQAFCCLMLTQGVLLALGVGSASAQAKFEENVVLLKLTSAAVSRLNIRIENGIVQTGLPSIDALNQQHNALAMKRILRNGGKLEARHAQSGLTRYFKLTFERGTNVESLLQAYAKDANIESAQPNWSGQLVGDQKKPNRVNFTPNDPQFSNQWHYYNTGQSGGTSDADIDLPEAWDIETGDPSVIVSDLDTGQDLDHPDLAANTWVNPGEIANNGLDDDNNGFIDDVNGWDFANNDNNPDDDNNHGTHTAGTVAAVTNNGIGVAGVAFNAKVMPCKWINSSGSGLSSDAAEAFIYAADNGSIVSNNSWRLFSQSDAVEDAIDYFLATTNGVVVFAAGNDNSSNPAIGYPASYPPVIAVAATTHTDQKAYYSNYGTWVDVSAPGGETNVVAQRGVFSTVRGGGYAYFQGTSMACPHVAGVAALLFSQNPGWTGAQVRAQLEATTDNIDALNPGFLGLLGTGRVNAFKALSPILDPPDIAVVPLSFTFNVPEGGSASDVMTISNTAGAGAQNLNWNIAKAEGTLVFSNGRTLPVRLQRATAETSGELNQIILDHEPGKNDPDPPAGPPVIAGSGGPDAFGYTWIDSDEPGGPAFNWQDISAVGTPVSLTDDSFIDVTLPFSFPFYGVNKTLMKLGANGYLTFGTTGTDFSNDPIPNTIQPNDFIAPFWDDLNPSLGGTIHYYHNTTTNEFIVQYTNIQHYGGTGTYTFEVILHPDGKILVQYLTMSGVLNSATIGIENADASIGLQMVYNASYVHDNLAVLIQVGCTWLSATPASGSIPPGSSQDVNILVDAAGLATGTYNCNLSLMSNDPDEPVVTIPVQLNVGSLSSITVSSPNGGENWQVGTIQQIAWTSTGTSGNVMIEYSTDNGTTWATIVASTLDAGTHSWTIPNTPTSSALVQISDIDGSPSDQSNAIFTISPVPVITVTSPNGGENWQVGSTQQITWTSIGTSGNVKIEYSSDNGTTWSTIVASTLDAGTHSWMIPNTPTSSALVQISDIDGSPSDQSNAIFTISPVPVITVNSPNGGESWQVGSMQQITWTSIGTSGNVKIEYSTDNGTTWSTIIASTPDAGTHSWTIPNMPTSNALVQISDIDGSPSDQSNAIFTISPVPVIQVTVQTSLSGRSFSVDGNNYTTPQTFTWTPGSPHTIATTSPQSGGTGTQYVWSDWSDGGAISHTVSPTSNTTFTANFTTQYYLTMNAGTGGTVSPSSSWQNSAQSVQISATPNSGYAFSGWTGTGTGSYTGSNNPATITMDGPITETASFINLTVDVLIWLPPDVTDPNFAKKAQERGLTEAEVRAMAMQPESHLALHAALTANGKSSAIIPDITSVNLSSFEAVFAVVGAWPNNHQILANSAEALAIVNYVQGGGRMYMEGNDVWYWDPIFGGHDFGPLFSLDGLADSGGNFDTILGSTFAVGMNFSYNCLTGANDEIGPLGTAVVIHSNQSPAFDCGVAFDQGTYKTIGVSHQFGCLVDGASTKTQLMAAYLNFFSPLIGLNPTADTYVKSDVPTTNFGTATTLRMRQASIILNSYLKFVVSGVTGVVQSAKLRMTVTAASNSGGSIFSVSNNFLGTSNPWTETGLNFNNAPSLSGSPLSTVGSVTAGQLVEFDVTPAITGNGTFSFGLNNASTTAVQYSSKEGANPPQLVIEVGPPPPPPTITSFTPTTGSVGASVIITGTNLSTTSQVKFNGVSASFSGVTNTQVTAIVPTGATTGKISIITLGGTATSAGDFTVVPIIVLNPTYDAYVKSDVPTTNFGTATTLRLKQSSVIMNSYLKFVVSGVTGVVQSAKLRMTVTAASNSGGSVFLVSNNFLGTSNPWTETGLNFNNAPSLSGSPLSTIGSVTVGQLVEFDVTPAITGNGTFSFGLNNASTTTVQYSSKEGANPPQLVIEVGPPPPPPTITSFTPPSGPVGATVTITGTDLSTTSQVKFNGVSASFSGVTNTQVTAIVPTGATTGLISVTTLGGTATSAAAFTVSPPPPAFNPVADAYVKSDQAATNFGTVTTLRMKQGAAILNSYLKFVVSGLSGAVQSAKLRMQVTTASNSGGSVYSVSNNYLGTSTPWTETGINYNNAPTISGTPLSTVGSVTVGQVVEFDVTSAITGNGTFSFGLKNSSTTAVQYSSKEGATKPELVIQTSAGALAKVANHRMDDAALENAATPLPKEFTLSSNYPNPFNAQTVIEYALPEAARVRLVVYNIAGQMVRKLVDETQPAGYKRILWDGKNESGGEMSSGIYFLQLRTDRQKLMRKLTLQK